MVVITSDHGESLGDHGLTYHGAALYWELIRVPLIVPVLPATSPVRTARLSTGHQRSDSIATVMDLVSSNAAKHFLARR